MDLKFLRDPQRVCKANVKIIVHRKIIRILSENEHRVLISHFPRQFKSFSQLYHRDYIYIARYHPTISTIFHYFKFLLKLYTNFRIQFEFILP